MVANISVDSHNTTVEEGWPRLVIHISVAAFSLLPRRLPPRSSRIFSVFKIYTCNVARQSHFE